MLPPVIHVERLTRRFGGVTAVEDLSFRLERGEVVGFLGPNGAGKTTTMRILTGYLPATSGSVRVAGLDVLRQSLEVRRRIGYLPESVPLYRELRVREMLLFQARLHRMGRAERVRRIPEVLEQVGIAERADALVGHLSRGQRQRVGIAVALLHKPEVLFLDEPTSGLDPLQRLEMRRLLKGLAEHHTVLLSSHILPEIEAVCPRVIILSRGRIAADGTPAELVRQLGSGSHVRLEAVVGADVEAALRLLRSLRGVGEVRHEGRVGIHHVFLLPCEEDLREDVGALAASRGWALRELSWSRPTLEQLFARIALDLGHGEGSVDGRVESEVGGRLMAPSAGEPAPTLLLDPKLQSPPAAAHATPGKPPPLGVTGLEAKAGKPVYNLNPFEGGGRRDLSAPKVIEPPPHKEPRAGSESCRDERGAS